jgi:acyl-CoA hydrolase
MPRLSPAADTPPTAWFVPVRVYTTAAEGTGCSKASRHCPGCPETQPTTRLTRTVKESQHETSEIMMPGHANNLGHVFGGVVLAMMDKTAAVAAIRHSRTSCVTASIDRVDFREPIYLGDLVVMHASVNYVGRTSMEVGVRVEAEDLLESDVRIPAT